MKDDWTRKADLEELHQLLKKEPEKRYRNTIERRISDIVHQSGASRELRDKLVRAFRAGDERARKYYENKLLLLKQENEYGQQF